MELVGCTIDELKKAKYKESIANFFLVGGGTSGIDEMWDEIKDLVS